MAETTVLIFLLTTSQTMTRNKKEFYQMEEESTKLKQSQEVILINKFRQSLTNQDKTTQLFCNKQAKEKKIQILFMVHSEYSLEDYLYQELSVTLRPKEKNLEVTRM